MNTREAKEVLKEVLHELKALSKEDLMGRPTLEVREIVGASGAKYQMEIQVEIRRAKCAICVDAIGSIDDGGLRAFAPITRVLSWRIEDK